MEHCHQEYQYETINDNLNQTTNILKNEKTNSKHDIRMKKQIANMI